ncbi:DNA polymerase III subunit delta' [Thermodesulfobacteriota bacterium]
MTGLKNFRSFSKIYVQDKAISYIKKAMERDKIPHAYLFSGIAGVGKTSTALAFTQALNCLNPVEGDGCGRCQTCRQIVNGNFPDINILRPDGRNIKIEQIRELNRELSFKPMSGRYRVSILHEADKMTEEASNSFLKTLEEPPPGNIIILKVTEPLDLLPTIVSRCQKVPFRPLPEYVVGKWLRSEMGISDEDSLLLSKISEGSLGRAIEIYESGLLEERQNLLSRIIQLSGLTSSQTLEMAVEFSKQKKGTGHDKSSKKNVDLSELLGIWKTWYRDLILMKMKDPPELLINFDFSRKLKSASKNFKMDNLIESVFIIDRAQRGLNRNLNLGLMMENLLLELKRFADSQTRSNYNRSID